MNRITLLIAATALAGNAYAAEGTLSKNDQSFINQLAQGGMTEVRVAEYVRDHGTNDEVKQLATRIVDDHTKNNNELQKLASDKGMTLTTTLDNKHQKIVDQIMGEQGTKLDTDFTKRMVTDHKDTINLVEKVSKKADDADLRAWAQKTLPTLREHLQQAQSTQHMMTGSSTGAGTKTGGGMHHHKH
jgi:putative membrane protein